MEKKEKKVVFTLFLLSFLLYSLPVYLSHEYYGGIDSMIYNTFAKNILEKKSLILQDQFNGRYNTFAFSPRFVVYVQDKGLVQLSPFGLSIYLAFIGFFLLGKISYVIPLTGALGVIVFYYLVRELYGKKHALVSSILLTTLPAYWSWSILIMPEVPSIFLLLLLLFLLEKSFDSEKSNRLYVLSGLLLSFWVWVRYHNIILYPAIAVYIIFRSRKRSNLRGLFLVAVTCIILLSGIPIYNKLVFGSFFTIGHMEYQKQTYTIWSSLIPVDIKALIKFLARLPLTSPFIVPYTIVGFLGLLSAIQKKDAFSMFVFIAIVSFLIFFGNYTWFYKAEPNDFSTQSTMLRRLTPVYVLLLIYVYPVLEKLLKGKMLFLGVLLLFSANVGVSLFQPIGSIRNVVDSANDHYRIHETVLNYTESDAVVFTAFFDKSVFPERTVFSYGKTADDTGVSDMLRVTRELLVDGRKIYFLADLDYLPSNVDNITVAAYLDSTTHIHLNYTGNRMIDEEVGLYRILDVK